MRGVEEKNSLSRIFKAQEPLDDGCGHHPFPQLGDEESLEKALRKANGDDFLPVCPGAAKDSKGGEFEQSFQRSGGAPESGESEVDLEQEHANALKEAFSKGFVEGENSGSLSERQRIEPALEALNASVGDLQRYRDSLSAHFEKASVELAIAIAQKIVCHEVSINKQTIVDVLKKAAKETGGSEILKIRINPSDLQVLQEEGLSPSDLNALDATLEGDSALSSGSCVIETDFGCVDATIEHQLETLEEAFRERFC